MPTTPARAPAEPATALLAAPTKVAEGEGFWVPEAEPVPTATLVGTTAEELAGEVALE